MNKTLDSIYVTPGIECIDIKSEGILCSSENSNEDVLENLGVW